MKYVACGIMYHNDKILMGKRSPASDSPGLWEFPGGKLEKGETIEQCLHREWKEELNLTILIDRQVAVSTVEKDITCYFFIGKILDITHLQKNVHEFIDFFYPYEIKNLQLFEGDEVIVDMLC
tara:strand:- start:5130 stop:5498 length:369 start_codon:yes stop_codon:yes gene_type:complete